MASGVELYSGRKRASRSFACEDESNQTSQVAPASLPTKAPVSFSPSQNAMPDLALTTSLASSAGALKIEYVTGLSDRLNSPEMIKETNSLTDIGFHYVAIGTDGVPISSGCDGIPDYVKDINGDVSMFV
jgi:hypothetical protein